jgi:hypothetical protein
MAKRKRTAKQARAAQQPAPAAPASDFVPPVQQETQIFIGSGGSALHDLFQQQVRTVLDQSDLDEQAKQAILVAMNCPCCGAGGMNYTAKINRRT